jgi:uncharacterized protein YkwD
MLRAASVFLFLALAGGALSSGAEVFPVPVPETRGEKQMALERQVFALINDYRHDHDLPGLTWNDAIAETARGHSRDMAEGRVDFGHDGFGDRVSHLREALGRVAGAGENVLYTDDPRDIARAAVTEWLHSPPHLHNIRGDFTYSGIGVWRSTDGTVYFTQIFLRLMPAPMPAANGPALIPPAMIVGPRSFGDLSSRSPDSN